MFAIMKKEAKKAEKTLGTKKIIGELKFQKELQTLESELDSNITIKFPDPNNILEFHAIIKIDYPDSYWYGGTYKFLIKIPHDYPFAPPKAFCLTTVYHPNIDKENG